MFKSKTNTKVIVTATVTRQNGTVEDLGVIASTKVDSSIWTRLIKILKG